MTGRIAGAELRDLVVVLEIGATAEAVLAVRRAIFHTERPRETGLGHGLARHDSALDGRQRALHHLSVVGVGGTETCPGILELARWMADPPGDVYGVGAGI